MLDKESELNIKTISLKNPKLKFFFDQSTDFHKISPKFCFDN